jgi:hypothetical protein
MDRDEKSELAITGIGTVAKLFGLANPAAATVGIVAGYINDRRIKKFGKRLESLILSLQKRIEKLEEEPNVETNLDLLDEIVAKAIRDEDEDKTEYYAALIVYYVSGNQNQYQVRLLSDAFKDLTIHEIKAFVHFNKHGSLHHDIPEDLKELFWDRVQTLGLHQRGKTALPDYTTLLGKKFLEVCKLAESERANPK